MKTLFNGTQICARAFGTVAIIDWYSLPWVMKNSVNGDIQHSQSFTWKYVKTKEPPYTERYVRWCGRSVDKIIIYLLPDWRFLNIVFATLLDNDFSVCLLWLWQTLMEIPDSTQASASLRADTLQLLPLYYVIEVGGGTNWVTGIRILGNSACVS